MDKNINRIKVVVAEKCTGCCKVFAGSDGSYKYAVIKKSEDIRELIKEMNTALNGRGGGRDGFAQGSVNCTKKDIVKHFS